MTHQPTHPAATHQHPPEEAPLVLSVSIGTRGGHQLLTVSGDLGGGTSELLRTRLSEARTVSQHLLIDLTEMRSVDAGGLAVLLDAQQRSTLHGGCLHLVTGIAVTHLETATGLWRTLRPHPTRNSAVASCPYRTGDRTRH